MILTICRHSPRITTGDVLQGLVVLGLLINQALGQLVNPPPIHPLPLHDHHPDLPIQFFGQLLVASQFDQMGSFLFGLGFYRCYQQASLAGLDAGRIVRRLMIGLLGFGLSLSLGLRSADLLAIFAVLSFSLLYFRSHSVARLLSWMVGLAGLAILVLSWLALLHPAEVTRHSHIFAHYLSYHLMMLGGLLVGKLGINQRDPKLRVRLSLLQVGLLPVALLVKGAWVIMMLGLVALPQRVIAYQPLLVALSGFFGPSLLTGVYVLDVGLNARFTPSGLVSWLGLVGQLSVTNYVFQSILCPLLLYGYGVAVSGSLTVLGRAGIVVGIYAVQLVLSYVWLRHYRRGPLEWICRQWIYGKGGQSNSVSTSKH